MFANSSVSRGFMYYDRDIAKSFKPIEKSGYWDAMKESKRRGEALDTYLARQAGSECGCVGACVFSGRSEYLRCVLPYQRSSAVHQRIYADVCSFQTTSKWTMKGRGGEDDSREDATVFNVDEIDDICEFDESDVES